MTRVAVPSRGRLRDEVLVLLERAGYKYGARGAGPQPGAGGTELIEMRPRDAAAWLAAGRIDGAFISTDIVLEEGLEDLASLALQVARSELVLAGRENDPRSSAAELAGAVVATHMPKVTADWFAQQGVEVTVVTMGGALEGVCAAGMADAIVDLRETGTSLRQNRLRVLATLAPCEALFVHAGGPAMEGVVLRLSAALEARQQRYVMLHLPRARLDDLIAIFPGLASPTVLPLAGRDDLVAVHFVVSGAAFWQQLQQVQSVGATGIVSLTPDAILR